MQPPRAPSLDPLPQGNSNDPRYCYYYYGGGGGISNGKKTSLRNSSSLQDFSSYSSQFRSSFDPDKSSTVDFESHENPSSSTDLFKDAVRFGNRKKLSRLGFVMTLLVLITLVTVSFCYFFRGGNWLGKSSPSYFVVLDSGSTGTRVFVYEATDVDTNDTGANGGMGIRLRQLPETMVGRTGRAYRRMETEPGLANLAFNTSGLISVITPLLRWAENQIPRTEYKRTRVFLFATAGVRKLPKPSSDWILDTAWSVLRNSAFDSRREWVRVISGVEEGYYGWIALNYHLGNLGGGRETLGGLDLGGSSLQVTFEEDDGGDDVDGLDFSIGGVHHHLTAYSLFGYGLNDAFEKSVVHLLKKTDQQTDDDDNGIIKLNHPCLQTGYEEAYVCTQCPVQSGSSSSSITLIGAPNWDECNSLAIATVNSSEWTSLSGAIDCDVRPCALGPDQGRPHGKFLAMSGFFVVYKFFNLSTEDATLDDMVEKGKDFCEVSWDVAKASVKPQPLIEQYCFRAPYVAGLLRYGLHLQNDQVVIGSGSITWTLGVALLQSSSKSLIKAPLIGALPWTSHDKLWILLPVMMPVILLSCMVWYCFCRAFRKQYLPFALRRDDLPNSFGLRIWRTNPEIGRAHV